MGASFICFLDWVDTLLDNQREVIMGNFLILLTLILLCGCQDDSLQKSIQKLDIGKELKYIIIVEPNYHTEYIIKRIK